MRRVIAATAAVLIASTGRAGPPLGRTPSPTAADLAEQRQFVDGVIDPRFTLDLVAGRPRLILLKQPPTQTQLADPSLAAVQPLAPKQLAVMGLRSGTTVLNLSFVTPDGRETVIPYLVRVLPNPEEKARTAAALRATTLEVNRAFPDSRAQLAAVGGAVILSGQAHDAADAAKINRTVR